MNCQVFWGKSKIFSGTIRLGRTWQGGKPEVGLTCWHSGHSAQSGPGVSCGVGDLSTLPLVLQEPLACSDSTSVLTGSDTQMCSREEQLCSPWFGFLSVAKGIMGNFRSAIPLLWWTWWLLPAPSRHPSQASDYALCLNCLDFNWGKKHTSQVCF